jgi:hypothetical protein
MRNLWLGLVIGALTGAAVGAAVDGARRAGQAAARVGHKVEHSISEHKPNVNAAGIADKVHAAAIADKVREVDLPDRARAVAARLAESPVAETTRHAGHVLADTARRSEERTEKFALEHPPRKGDGDPTD